MRVWQDPTSSSPFVRTQRGTFLQRKLGLFVILSAMESPPSPCTTTILSNALMGEVDWTMAGHKQRILRSNLNAGNTVDRRGGWTTENAMQRSQ
jgi:hypothetical protein